MIPPALRIPAAVSAVSASAIPVAEAVAVALSAVYSGNFYAVVGRRVSF